MGIWEYSTSGNWQLNSLSGKSPFSIAKSWNIICSYSFYSYAKLLEGMGLVERRNCRKIPLVLTLKNGGINFRVNLVNLPANSERIWENFQGHRSEKKDAQYFCVGIHFCRHSNYAVCGWFFWLHVYALTRKSA